MKKKFKYIFPLLFCLFLTVFFFWKFFFKGLIPIPADITAGMYFPWLDYKWGYATGVPVKNPILSDPVSQIWVWRNLAIEMFKKGEVPFWNPYSGSGTPLVALFHSAAFSPLNLFYFFFPRELAMSLIVISQPLLALIFTYLFLRVLGLNKTSSLLGGVTFAFGGFMTVWLTWGTVAAVGASLPAILWASEKLIKTGKFRYFVFQILAFSFALQNAYLQTFYYIGIFWGLYVFFRFFELPSKETKINLIKNTILTAFFVFVINAFSILPALESLRLSIRGIEEYLGGRNYGFLPFSNLIKFFAPDFFGNHATGNYWGELNYQELVPYFGLVPLSLVMISLIKRKSKKIVSFFVLIFLMSLGFALKYPFGWIIYKLNVPLLNKAGASRILFLVNFSGAVLAAFGLEEFAKIEKRNIFKKALYTCWLPIIGVGLGVLIALYLFNNFSEYSLFQNPNIWKTNLKVGLRNLIFPSGILFLTSIVFFIKSLKIKVLKNILTWGLVLLTVGELFRFGFKYTPFVPKNLFFPNTPVLEFLQKQKGVFRIEKELGPLLPPNMWIPYGLESASTYDPVRPLNYGYFIEGIIGGKPNRYLELEKDDFALMNFLGVKYFLVLKYESSGEISPKGKIPHQIEESYVPVFEDGSVAILENKKAFPQAFWISETTLEKLEKTLDLEILEKEEKRGEVNFESFSPQSFKLTTKLPSDGVVFVSVNYAPGWKVYLDGFRKEFKKSNLPFLIVPISEGQHNLLYKYDPDSFKLGLKISSLGVILLIIYYFVCRKSLFMAHYRLK